MTSKKNNGHVEPEENKTAPNQAAMTEENSAVDTESQDVTSPETASEPSPDDTAPVDSKPKSEELEEKQGKRGVKLATIAIVITVLIGGGLTFYIQEKNQQQQAQIDALQSELNQAKQAMQAQLDQNQQQILSKATELSHRADTVLEQQQKSIESLQLAMADVKGRRPNDWLLAEADYLVKLAGRKLFLEHDAVSATKLMESADQRIAALNDPSLVPLRKSMANDITKLKGVPLVDREGLVLRLTALQQQVDSLPLANAILPEGASGGSSSSLARRGRLERQPDDLVTRVLRELYYVPNS